MERKPLQRKPMKRGESQLKRTPMKRSEPKAAKPGTPLQRKPMKRTPMKAAEPSAERAATKPRKPMKRGGSELKRTPMQRGESQLKQGEGLKRTPMKAGEKGLTSTGSAKPRKALKPVSEKRKEENKIRRELMLAKFGPRETWKCQIGHLIGTPCFGAINGHEPKARSAGGSIIDMENVMLACNHHNEWVESHPNEAHALGLKKWSWED